MRIKNVLKGWMLPGMTALLIVFFLATMTWAASAPRLNLFPKDVTEHLSETGETARAMESELKVAIKGLETQMSLFKASECEGSTGDPGCEKINRQMGESYQEMLDIMKASLPDMKQSIRATNKGIEKNLRRELGGKTTPAELQKMLAKKTKPKVIKGRFSLSARFAKYHSLISSGSGQSLAKLAAEIYLDSKQVLEMIDLMDAEMARQETIIKLGSMYGTITPEMTSTVDAVKTVIFGEAETESTLPEAPEGEVGGFQSPLRKY